MLAAMGPSRPRPPQALHSPAQSRRKGGWSQASKCFLPGARLRGFRQNIIFSPLAPPPRGPWIMMAVFILLRDEDLRASGVPHIPTDQQETGPAS